MRATKGCILYHISNVEVTAFRGNDVNITIPLNNEVNFLIGRNGTGKTSLINLIAAALTVDVRGLIQSDFKSLRFKLRRSGDRSRPIIEVSRTYSESNGPGVTYGIAEGSSRERKLFELRFSDMRTPWLQASYARLARIQRSPESSDDVLSRTKSAIEKLVQVSWLSVHRATSSSADDNDEKFASPVDRRLQQVSRDFGIYFSTLDKKAAGETDKFQQIFLLSLISPSKFEGMAWVNQLDAEAEKAAIKNIFAEFKIKSSVFNTKLDNFAIRMSKALRNYNPNQGILADDFLVLTDTARIHDVIKEWHNLVEARATIYKPKADFETIVNELFFRKKLTINAGNEPIFEDHRGRPLKLDALSTGEKQMFILLGEALLQRRAECVFLADEPELSLHIDWQEKLVPSLRRINPNAQILFATHSPDIVGAYGVQAINLEKLI